MRVKFLRNNDNIIHSHQSNGQKQKAIAENDTMVNDDSDVY